MAIAFLRASLCIVALVAAEHASAQQGSDAAREKRWADQVLASLVVGDPAWLAAADGVRFLALFASPERAKAGVILAHGPGLHPDPGIIGELRVALVDRGFATLSLQMPVLPAEDEAGTGYRELFPEAVQRIAAGMAFLHGRGFKRIAIVSHAMGSGMSYEYLRRNRDAPVFAWAALSFYGVFDELGRAPFPVFDL